MNAPLRRVGIVVFVLFGLLFANLNWIQVYKSDAYRTDDEHNHARVQAAEYERARGNITVDSVIVAKSTLTNDTLKYQRVYPGGPTYAHVVGYKGVELLSTDVERMENDFLAGTANSLAGQRLLEMFTGKRSPGGNVKLSVRKQVQETAYNELTNNQLGVTRGAVVALDPTTGAILGLVSMPSYDPKDLVSHNPQTALKAYNKLDQDPNKPLLNRALSETFPPGSTFKVVVSAAALQAGIGPETTLTGGSAYTAPDTTQEIHNAQGVNCPSTITLKQALTVSCNTAFARLGVEKLGADRVKQAAQSFGFEDAPLIERDEDNIMRVAASATGAIQGPDGQEDRPALAQSCIGQRDVRMTPLQGAMIAAAVANNGTQMRPYLIDNLQTQELETVYSANPSELRQSVSGEVAAQLRDMMVSVVENGTGKAAQIDGAIVGGKTGTAQNGDAPDHGWFIGFAIKDGKPVVAVAVLLQNAGPGGSREATRIGGEVMQAAIKAKGPN